jgi:protein transport protein SEC61 subunit alpha
MSVQASTENSSNLAVYVLAFFLTTMGIVYVQEAERKIPMNYASRYRTGSLGRQSYLPFKVQCTSGILAARECLLHCS